MQLCFRNTLACAEIDDIYVYSSNHEIVNLLPEGVKLLPRPNYLNGDAIRANELFRYAVERVDDEIIALCQIRTIHFANRYARIEKVQSGITVLHFL